MKIITQLVEAQQLIQTGHVLAYPTEAVYGLGCDPFNLQAVERLLLLKQRPSSKGFILLIADWDQLYPLIRSIPDKVMEKIAKGWPGPTTWLFPKSTQIPAIISGASDHIAIRMSAHPIAHELCLCGPIVSTSANVTGSPPAKDLIALEDQFPMGIDGVVAGALGDLEKPTAIFDALSAKQIR